MKKSFLFLSVILSISCFSQISQDGIPLSFTQTLSREVPTVIITPPNTNALESEDNENALKGKPYRYAVQVEILMLQKMDCGKILKMILEYGELI